MKRNLKHAVYKVEWNDGELEIDHYIAPNNFSISITNKTSDETTMVDFLTRDELRKIRDEINKIIEGLNPHGRRIGG